LHRHLPAAKLDHARAQGAVGVVEGRTFGHEKVPSDRLSVTSKKL
jgi:hypothetical protein